MNLEKVTFENKNGQRLEGRLELPVDRHPHNFVIFAHCFTCNKNLLAVKNIGRALTSHGLGVLRFDFTGLGDSEGDFSETNFSGNVDDLVAAAHYLEAEHRAPTLLVGHSLGGAAVIFAATKIASVKAIATIGAPSDPSHVQHLLKSSLEEIEAHGKAVVNLSGRDFTIKKQFLEDLSQKSLPETVKALRKAILLFHAPQDTIVGIENAEAIYKAARHPKSFVSLDGADHLLMDQKDSLYVGEVIAGWAKRYLSIEEKEALPTTNHQVVASLDAQDGFTTQLKAGKHSLTADEPTSFGGNDFGPSPYELVSSGLSACTVMTLQMYAKRKNWPLQNVTVHTSFGKFHAVDCEQCETDSAKLDTFEREIQLEGDLNQKQRERLLQIADKCPVHKTLHGNVQVITKLADNA